MSAAHDPMRVAIGRAYLPSPVLTAAGTFGYGTEYRHLCDYSKLGAFICKSITMAPREGNPPPRLKELPSGNLNSIGLANVGVHRFISEKLPMASRLGCNVIVNVAGKDEREYARIISLIESCAHADAVWGWELNLSCPNISGGTNIGYDPKLIAKTVRRAKRATARPVLVKLPPSVDRIAELSRAAEGGGADAICAINTVPAMWIDTAARGAYFARGTAGLAGDAIFPMALAMVHAACRAVRIPVIGVGGITEPDRALQFFIAGARAVQVGSGTFKNPRLFEACFDAAQKFFVGPPS